MLSKKVESSYGVPRMKNFVTLIIFWIWNNGTESFCANEMRGLNTLSAEEIHDTHSKTQ